MTTIVMPLAEAKDELSELVNRVSHYKERIILTRRDKEIAAIIPLEDLWILENSQNKHDLDDALEALKEARQEGFVSLEDLIEKVETHQS